MTSPYKHKGLRELRRDGTTSKINANHHARCLRIIDALAQAQRPEDMNVPGFDFHGLQGHTPTRYAVSVNGPWRITFEFNGVDACGIDYEQYH